MPFYFFPQTFLGPGFYISRVFSKLILLFSGNDMDSPLTPTYDSREGKIPCFNHSHWKILRFYSTSFVNVSYKLIFKKAEPFF